MPTMPVQNAQDKAKYRRIGAAFLVGSAVSFTIPIVLIVLRASELVAVFVGMACFICWVLTLYFGLYMTITGKKPPMQTRRDDIFMIAAGKPNSFTPQKPPWPPSVDHAPRFPGVQPPPAPYYSQGPDVHVSAADGPQPPHYGQATGTPQRYEAPQAPNPVWPQQQYPQQPYPQQQQYPNPPYPPQQG